MVGVYVDQQFYWQQVNDGVGYVDIVEQYVEEVEYIGEYYCLVGGYCFGVDDGGYCVGSVVEVVDEFEGEDEGQGQYQVDIYLGIEFVEKIEYVRNWLEMGW